MGTIIKEIPYGKESKKVIEKLESGRIRVYTINSDADMCDQSFAEENETKTVVKKIMQGRAPGVVVKGPGQNMDLTDAPQNLMDAQIKMQDAGKTFAGLPDDVKKEAKTPSGFLQWLLDPKNRARATELGYYEKPSLVQDEPGGKTPESKSEQTTPKEGE